MARRHRNDSAPTPAPEVRAAHPSRSLVSLTPASALTVSLFGTGAVAGSWGALGPHLGDPRALAVGGAVAAAGAAVGAVKFRGRTLGQWMTVRRESRVELEQSVLFSRDSGIGITFDGVTASAYVQVEPRPWQMTRIDAHGVSQAPVIEAEILREQLSAYGIDLSRITVINAGFKFAARDGAARVLDQLIGPVSVPLGGTTVLKVSLDLDDGSLAPSYIRGRNGSLPDGLCQAVTIAASRVRGALNENGFRGSLMRASQIRAFHDTVLQAVAKPLCDPRWKTCGKPSEVHTRTYSPARGHWNAESAAAWYHLRAHRQYTSMTLTPESGGRALVQPLTTYLIRGGDELSHAETYGLAAAKGQQSAGLAQALLVSGSVTLRTPGAMIDENTRLAFGIPSGGAGVFVGIQPDGTRIFVGVSAAEEPMWVCGPLMFALQEVARLSTHDLRIAVMDEHPAWKALADHRASEDLTVGTLGTAPADVVVCSPQWWERNRALTRDKAVLLVTDGDPGRGSSASMSVVVREGRAMIEVRADNDSADVEWQMTQLERDTLLGPAADLAEAALAETAAAASEQALPQVSPSHGRQAVGDEHVPVLRPPTDPGPAGPVVQGPVDSAGQDAMVLPDGEAVARPVPDAPPAVLDDGLDVPALAVAGPELDAAADVSPLDPAAPAQDWGPGDPTWVPGAEPGVESGPAAVDEAPTELIPAITEDSAPTELTPGPVADEAPTELIPAITEDEAPTQLIPAVTEDETPTELIPAITDTPSLGRHRLAGDMPQ